MSAGRDLPGADRALLLRVIARQDAVEADLVRLRGDVDRLTNATTALTETMRRLPATSPAEPGPAGSGGASEVDLVAAQCDWLTVTDPQVATAWLVEVTAWWTAVAEVLLGPTVACWPWHPRSVAAALALQTHWVQAYADPRAVSVSDLLTRWVPALGRIVSPRDGDCTRHEHHEGDVAFVVHLDLLPEYAVWWATTRAGTPPGLTRRRST